MKTPLSIPGPTVTVQERLAWYRKRRTILAFIQWVPYLLVILVMYAVLQTENVSQAKLLGSLGLFLAAGATVYVLAVLWARCLACGEPFPLMIWTRQATMSMFPDYCSKCHAPVMALPLSQTPPRPQPVWPRALKIRYVEISRRCERWQAMVFRASIVLGILSLGRLVFRPFFHEGIADEFHFFQFYAAVYFSAFVLMLIFFRLVEAVDANVKPLSSMPASALGWSFLFS